MAIPWLCPLKQTPHLCLLKPLYLQFSPSLDNHSLPLSISSLSSTMVGRRLMSSSLLSRDSQRHHSPKPMASNNTTIPWLLYFNASLHPKTNLIQKVTLVALTQLLLTRKELHCFTGSFCVFTPIILPCVLCNCSELPLNTKSSSYPNSPHFQAFYSYILTHTFHYITFFSCKSHNKLSFIKYLHS